MDSRLESHYDKSSQSLSLTTKNVAELRVDPSLMTPPLAVSRLIIDGWDAGSANTRTMGIESWTVQKVNGKWQQGKRDTGFGAEKGSSLTGPIDDAFSEAFLIVMPDGVSENPKTSEWIKRESGHFVRRWRSLMRGDPRIKNASKVTQEVMENNHLILWGDFESNSLIRKTLASMPLEWDSESIRIGARHANSSHHVLCSIYPNGVANPAVSRYVVLNSGLTFREAHDKTNSLQNPKLPDWAILDITEPPDGERAGKVVAADFFDENWQVKGK